MHALTLTMTDADMSAIASYVSRQPWPTLDVRTLATDSVYRSGAIVAALGDCGGCHFADWQGYSANPRLRGQTPAYLTATIDEFRLGKRGNSPGMADLLRPLSSDEVKAVVAYLSSVE
jgi:cytochrome c553